jgi:sugar/nucleoside kinase (ribokinase family)
MTSDPLTSRGVLCSGAIIHDTLVHAYDDSPWGTTAFVETIEPHPGGNGSNTSLALASLGMPVRLLGTVGEDEAGRFLLSALRRAGVDTTAIALTAEPTARTIALVNRTGSRKFLHRLGCSANAFANGIEFTPDLTAGMAHYHLASLFILPALRTVACATVARARAAGLSTSFDTNWDPEGRWMRDVEPLLRHLDFIFLNEDEARMTTGTDDPAAAARCLLARGARTAIIKLGPRGCAVFTVDRELHCPAFAVEVRDTTGAGDTFVAGFLAAHLEGADLADAGRFANAAGALNVQQIGGSARIPSYREIQAWMRTA